MQSENQTINTSKGPKSLQSKIIMIAVIVIVFILGAVFGALVFGGKTGGEGNSNEKGSEYAVFDIDDYTPMLIIYSKLGDESSIDDLKDTVEETNKDAKVEIIGKSGNIKLLGSKEYIHFDIESGEEGESDAAYDFIYVYEDGEESMYIKKSGEDTYQHYNGAVTSDFSSKEEAISNHLGSIQ